MSSDVPTAPAAHLVTIQAAPVGGGVLVGHTLCDAPPAFVPNRPGLDYVIALDVIQATIGHVCVNSRESQ